MARGGFITNRNWYNSASDNKAISCLQTADGHTVYLVSSNSDRLKAACKAKQKSMNITQADTDAYAVIRYKNQMSAKSEFKFSNSYLS